MYDEYCTTDTIPEKALRPNDHRYERGERMSIAGALSYGDNREVPFGVLASSAGTQPLSPWSTLAVSAVRQALHDAAEGDYDALLWLVSEGRAWLAAAGFPSDVVDAWGAKL